MIFAIFAGIVFGSALTIFALENASIIGVNLLGLHFAEPVALVIVASSGLAIIATLLATLPAMLASEKRIKQLQIEKELVENELAKYRIVIPVAPPSSTMSPINVIEREKVYA